MLLPERIVEVNIAVDRKSLGSLVTALLKEGIFHPTPLTAKVSAAEDPIARRQLYEVSGKLEKISKYLGELNIFSPLGSYEVSIEGRDWIKAAERLLQEFRPLEDHVDGVFDSIQRARERLKQLEERKNMLEPFREFNVDLSIIAQLEYISVFIGSIPAASIMLLTQTLRETGIDYVMQALTREDRAYVVVISSRKRQQEVQRILNKLGFQPLAIPEHYPQNPMKAYQKVLSEIEGFERELESLREELRKRSEALIKYYNAFHAVKEALRVLSVAKHQGSLSFLSGYIPVGREKRLKEILESATKGLYMLVLGRVLKGAGKSASPTLVRVPRLLKPFHWIVSQYGIPSSSEIVPTVFVAVTFPVLYGLMFPDAGHALAILLFGIYMLKTARGREGRENLGLLAIYLGLAAFVSGFLAGEFFGPLTGFADKVWQGHPPLASPIEAGAEGGTFILIMTICFRIAAFMLISGTLLGLLNALLERNYHEAIAVKLPKFLMFTFATYPFLFYSLEKAGSIIYDATFGGAKTLEGALVRYGVLLGLLGLLALEPALEAVKHGVHRIKSVVPMVFLEMFETLLLVIGNTVSFLRILGLSLAHSGIMLGFAILAMLAAGGIVGNVVGAVIYIMGNLLAIGLEGIIVFAHTLRLHFYEWFTKFYSGTGVPFEPVFSPVVVRVL